MGAMGDVDGCRASLEQVRRRFDALGMAFWSERTAKLEAVARTAPRNPHAPGPDGLSPREMDILSKLASGGSAKAIASRPPVELGDGQAAPGEHLREDCCEFACRCDGLRREAPHRSALTPERLHLECTLRTMVPGVCT
jgi:hypothetical protein